MFVHVRKNHTNKKPLMYMFHVEIQLLGQHRPFLVVQMDWSPVCPSTAAAAAQWYFRSRNGFLLLWPLSKKEMYAQCWEMENQCILSHLTRLRRNSQERESVLPFYFSHPSSSFLFLLSLSLPLFTWITILFSLSLNFLSTSALVTALKAFS